MDPLKQLFDSYDPVLSDADDFIDELRRNMDSVEIVRRQIAGRRRRSGRAAVIAACVGFLAGCVATVVVARVAPFITSLWHSGISPSFLAFDWSAVGYVFIAAASTLSAIGTYSLVRSRL